MAPKAAPAYIALSCSGSSIIDTPGSFFGGFGAIAAPREETYRGWSYRIRPRAVNRPR
jgi:hypothetical protein